MMDDGEANWQKLPREGIASRKSIMGAVRCAVSVTLFLKGKAGKPDGHAVCCPEDGKESPIT
jgi:hypothetical protein